MREEYIEVYLVRDIFPISLPASSDCILEVINCHFFVAKVSCLDLCVNLKRTRVSARLIPPIGLGPHLDSRVCWNQVLWNLVSLVNGNARANNGIVLEIRHWSGKDMLSKEALG